MTWSVVFLVIPLITIVYYLSYFSVAILLGVHNKHYFLGFGKRLFEIRSGTVTFTVGYFIPIFLLARIYKLQDAEKHRPDHPWQFHDRPWVSRALTTYSGAAGVLVFTLMILIALNIFVDEQYISRDEMNKYGINPSSLAETYGFKRGDKVMTINGQAFESYYELLEPEAYQTSGNTFLIERKGKEMIIRVPEGDHDLSTGRFLDIYVPLEIDSVVESSPAELIGLQKGDRIAAVNGEEIDKLSDMRLAFSKDIDDTVELQIQRLKNSDTLMLVHEVRLDAQDKLGIFTRTPVYNVKANSLSHAVLKGTNSTFWLLGTQFATYFLKFGTVPEGEDGPISVSAAFGDARYWEYFWYVTASYASLCVVWNVLPYPRSAFWEMIALAYEWIKRKEYPYTLFKRSLKLAWFIFWGMILYMFVMDLRRLF